MPANVKTCEYCKFKIPQAARVCGHCGAKFRTEVYDYERGWIVRFLMGIWGLVKGAFTVCITALAAGYFFAAPGNIAVWGVLGALAGGFIGFIGGISGSKTKTNTFEIAERE